MKITWFGQNSFLLQMDNLKIYIDPYAGEDENYSPADIVLITHSHFDHFNIEKTKKCMNDNTFLFGPKDVASQLLGIHEVHLDEKHSVDKITFEVLPAYNVTAPKGEHKKENCFGYLLKGSKSIYFAGDTDIIPEMYKINADIVVLPVGGTYTMGPRDAAKVVEIIQPKLAIPCHYGSIVGSVEDAELFKELVESKGFKCLILKENIEEEI